MRSSSDAFGILIRRFGALIPSWQPRQTSTEELDARITELEAKIADANRKFEAGKASGSMKHHSEYNIHISYRAAESYARMVDYINQLEMQLRDLKR